jgi:tetratricopeptide (TPR) repeat protein
VLSNVSRFLMLAAESTEAIRIGRRALGIAERLGLDELRAHALNNIGCARLEVGDLGGLDDLEQSVVVATEAGAPGETLRAQGNLGEWMWRMGKLERALSLWRSPTHRACPSDRAHHERLVRGAIPELQFQLGRWDDALAAVDEFVADAEASSSGFTSCICYEVRAQIRVGRDDITGALADAERALELARLTTQPEFRYPTMAACAHVFIECGEKERAASIAEAQMADMQAGKPFSRDFQVLPPLAWTLSALGRERELIGLLPKADVPWIHTARAFAEGDLRRAADCCGAMGAATQEARDRLWLAEELVKENRPAEAYPQLQQALAFYRSVDAIRYIREGEALLAASGQPMPSSG